MTFDFSSFLFGFVIGLWTETLMLAIIVWRASKE